MNEILTGDRHLCVCVCVRPLCEGPAITPPPDVLQLLHWRTWINTFSPPFSTSQQGGALGESVFACVLICVHQLLAVCGRLLGTAGPLSANFMHVSAGWAGGGRARRGNSGDMTARLF